MKYIASCSFGKNSVAQIILAKYHDEPIDEVLYSEVMFTQYISGEIPEHIKFIKEVAIPKFKRKFGLKTVTVRSTKSMWDIFHMVRTNEEKRLKRLEGTDKISLLNKYNVKDSDCFEICEKEGLLSPIYQFTNRNGCFFCPNASMSELRHIYHNHYSLWMMLRQLQETLNTSRRCFTKSKTIFDLEKQFEMEMMKEAN